MSADFEKVLVKDARLDVSDSIKYAVIKGGQNVTMAQYKAISATNNQIVFNIQVPSEQTIIDRRVLLQTELTLSVISTNLTTKKGCYYGIYSALASFPLHQLMTVMSATINNNTVSVNIRDVLPAMIRLIDTDDLICFNSSSPTFADTAVSYSPDACGGALPHPNSAYWGLNEPCCVVHRGAMAPIAYVGPTDQGAGASFKETFTWLLTEPLLLSPFFFANLKANNQGFYGIQNMNVVLNIGDTARVFRTLTGESASWANPSPALEAGSVINSVTNVYAGSALVGGLYFSNTQLLLNFLTPHPSDMLPARNIVPFYELPRYITPWTANVPPVTISTLSVSVPNTFVVRTQSLQLNQIPDKLIVYVRKNISQQSWGDSDTCFPISNIVVNFNNNSGILASAQQVDLYQMSRNNGLQETWHEFKGLAVGASTTVVPSSGTGSVVSVFPTVGSYLVLEFGKDIQLTEDFYAAGSLGNFNLQLNITCQNNRPYNLSVGGSYDNNVEAVLITMNSGVFVCERGTSSTYTGILTKQDVLEASQQDHYTHDDVERMVGGGFFDKIKSGFSKLASKGMEYGKKQLAKHGERLMNKGANYLMKKGKKALAKYTAPAEEEDEE
jgi:hypothetical protein